MKQRRSSLDVIVRQQVFFGLHDLIGSSLRSCFREFVDLERATPAALQGLQGQRLHRLLRHAVDSVPFYRERVDPGHAGDLAAFPILRKNDIRDHFPDLMTPRLRRDYEMHTQKRFSYSWIPVRTGGSTGVPTTVIHDPAFRDAGRAGRLYSRVLCGFPFGVPCFRLWGAMQDINRMRDSLPQRWMRQLGNEVVLNAFRLSETQMRQYLDAMCRSRRRHLIAYVDALYALAKFAERSALPVPALDSVMACAGTVTPEVRQTIERVFRTRVHNQYGSRDCAGIACECKRGGLHVYANQVFLETVDSEGHPVPPGRSGRLLVTLLSNLEFPMIRYEIGDVGALASEPCPCGRPFPLLQALEGRSVEFLHSTDGGYVSPVYIRHLIGVVHNPGLIRRFQLIQDSAVEFELRIEPEHAADRSALAGLEALLLRDLGAVLGTGAIIRVSHHEEIPETSSGKFLYTINRSGPR